MMMDVGYLIKRIAAQMISNVVHVCLPGRRGANIFNQIQGCGLGTGPEALKKGRIQNKQKHFVFVFSNSISMFEFD